MNNKIVIVDDDKQNIIPYYCKALRRAEFEVEHFASVDEFIAYFAKAERVGIFIIDIGMPPGNTLSAAETRNGKWTGFSLIKLVREKQPNAGVILLTYYDRLKIPGHLTSIAEGVVIAEKQNYPPTELVKLVKERFRA